MADLRPQGDLVLIDPEPPPDYQSYKKYEHIVVPERYEHGPEDRAVWGTVVALGTGCQEHGCKGMVKVGDRVVFGKYAGARIQYEGRLVILVREDELLAVDVPSRDLI